MDFLLCFLSVFPVLLAAFVNQGVALWKLFDRNFPSVARTLKAIRNGENPFRSPFPSRMWSLPWGNWGKSSTEEGSTGATRRGRRHHPASRDASGGGGVKSSGGGGVKLGAVVGGAPPVMPRPPLTPTAAPKRGRVSFEDAATDEAKGCVGTTPPDKCGQAEAQLSSSSAAVPKHRCRVSFEDLSTDKTKGCVGTPPPDKCGQADAPLSSSCAAVPSSTPRPAPPPPAPRGEVRMHGGVWSRGVKKQP